MQPELSRQIARHIDRGESRRLAELLLGLPEDQRRALMPVFTAEVRGVGWANRRKIGPLLVGGAACLPTAAQLAAWVNRSGLRVFHRDPGPFIEILLRREVPWLPDLATRVAAALPARPERWDWPFVAELVKVSGAATPTTDGFVWGWVLNWGLSDGPRRDWLRADPFLDELLPRLFEVDGLGQLLDVTVDTGALASLATERRISRTFVLDATLGRLLRGDRPSALRPFVALHRELDPTVDESTERRRTYLRLVRAEQSAVVALAQATLRALDRAGRLDPDDLIALSHDVLLRPEKAIVRTQLSWLDEAIRRNRDRADDFLAVLDTATRHDHLDLADRAAALIAKHGGTATAPKPAANPSPTPSPMPWTAPELPGPIEDVAELLSELASALRSDSDDLVAWERVVAGLAQLSVRRPDELRRALRTIVEPSRVDAAPFGVDWWQVEQLTRLARDLAYERAMRLRFWDFVRGGSRDATVDELRPRLLAGSGPQRVIVARLQELTLTVGTPAAEWPLATPTRVNGHLDLSVLVERLEALQACGAEPGPIDLEQALLRLPRELDHDAAARARRLSSPAGRTLVDWLDGGGLADPVMTTFTTTRGPSWTSQPAPDRRLVGIAAAPSDSGPVVQALLGARPGTGHTSDDLAFLFNRGWWPAVLPSHREVIAAYLLPGIADTAEFDQRGGARALPRLAETTGPTGPATALCLAYGLGARHADDRIATVDAAVQFAATGQLPAAVVGGHLGELCVNGNVKLTRAVAGLDEIVRAGAAAAAWLTIEAALPALLAAADRPRGLPDLLQLGARIAVPGPVPDALTDVAERGTGRLGVEAKRLRGVLAG